MKCPGGWVYKTAVGASVAIVFVPDPNNAVTLEVVQ